MNNKFIEIDASINNISRQDVKVMENQGELNFFKREILSESEHLMLLLFKSIDKNIWPMLKFDKKIWTFVKKRQKYLALLSNQNDFHSMTVIQQIDKWLIELDLRVFVIASVYKSSGNFIPKVNSLALKRENLGDYLKILKYKSLKHYKADLVHKIYTLKGINRFCLLRISTIKDWIVQTLFVQLIKPTVNVHVDNYRFKFYKGRNPYQVINLLRKLLNVKPRYQRYPNDKKYITHNKYIFNVAIKKFFNKITDDWLLKNYPFLLKFINVLKGWLSSEIISQSTNKTPVSIFSQKNVTTSSLTNFILSSLKKVIAPNKVTFFYQKKVTYSVCKGLHNNRINIFLQKQSLNRNFKKSKIFKWKNIIKTDYFGFTSRYILGKRFPKITMQKKYNKNFVQKGLYVYPPKSKVQTLKKKIKEIIKNNLNVSPYRLINLVNPIIISWGNYFGINTLKIYFRLDYYIWYRVWRYLKRKYKKVSIGKSLNLYFQNVQTPFGKIWQFYGTLNSVNNGTLKQKKTVVWVLLLSNLNKTVPVRLFFPSKVLFKSDYYIDDLLCNG